MDIKKFYTEVQGKLKAVFSGLTPEELKAFKEYRAKLEGELAPVIPAVAPVTLKQVKTKDGKELSYDGELKEGIAISLVDPATGPSAAPDATYELEDGTKITVSAGMVTKVEGMTPVAAPQLQAPVIPPVIPAPAQNFEAQLSAVKESYEGQIKELKQIQLSTLKTIEALKTAIENLPVDNIDLEGGKPVKLTKAEEYALSHPIN